MLLSSSAALMKIRLSSTVAYEVFTPIPTAALSELISTILSLMLKNFSILALSSSKSVKLITVIP